MALDDVAIVYDDGFCHCVELLVQHDKFVPVGDEDRIVRGCQRIVSTFCIFPAELRVCMSDDLIAFAPGAPLSPLVEHRVKAILEVLTPIYTPKLVAQILFFLKNTPQTECNLPQSAIAGISNTAVSSLITLFTRCGVCDGTSLRCEDDTVSALSQQTPLSEFTREDNNGKRSHHRFSNSQERAKLTISFRTGPARPLL